MTKKDIAFIAKHAFPLFVMVVMVLLMYFFPEIVNWLPRRLMEG